MRVTQKELPDFFTTRGSIPTQVTPLNFGQNIYWMSSVITETDNLRENTILKPYNDNEDGLVDCCELDENYDIVLDKSGKFTTSFYVPSSLISYIIGAKGVKLKTLQRTTNTLIKIPKINEKGDVKIVGDTERKVASARNQIAMIVMQRKERLPPSHFISIPILSKEIEKNLIEFQEEILKDPPRGVTASLFQKPYKMHLTICTLTLVDEEEIQAAKKVLQNCYDDVISNIFTKNTNFKIIIEGLEIMNDDPSEANVLYAKVRMHDKQQTEKLQYIAEEISEYYYKSGLAKRQYDRVKLHATVMNTSFRNAGEIQEKFDASNILKKYSNYYFGSVDLKNIHLSVRFTAGQSYYEAALIVDL